MGWDSLGIGSPKKPQRSLRSDFGTSGFVRIHGNNPRPGVSYKEFKARYFAAISGICLFVIPSSEVGARPGTQQVSFSRPLSLTLGWPGNGTRSTPGGGTRLGGWMAPRCIKCFFCMALVYFSSNKLKTGGNVFRILRAFLCSLSNFPKSAFRTFFAAHFLFFAFVAEYLNLKPFFACFW